LFVGTGVNPSPSACNESCLRDCSCIAGNLGFAIHGKPLAEIDL
jgi:hypothetical protein